MKIYVCFEETSRCERSAVVLRDGIQDVPVVAWGAEKELAVKAPGDGKFKEFEYVLAFSHFAAISCEYFTLVLLDAPLARIVDRARGNRRLSFSKRQPLSATCGPSSIDIASAGLYHAERLRAIQCVEI